MNNDNFHSILETAFSENNLSHLMNPRISDSFMKLASLLIAENEKYNLTAITEPRDIIYKHFVDSVLLSINIKYGSNLIDIGSGAGFPSLPLAIVRPDLNITAVDSTAKKVSFISMCTSELGLTNINAISARAEQLAHNKDYRARFDYATARAVSAFPVIFELSIPFLLRNGLFLAMKGAFGETEYSASCAALTKLNCEEMMINRYKLRTSDAFEDRTLIIIKKIGKTPDNFPRNYAQITRKPLK